MTLTLFHILHHSLDNDITTQCDMTKVGHKGGIGPIIRTILNTQHHISEVEPRLVFSQWIFCRHFHDRPKSNGKQKDKLIKKKKKKIGEQPMQGYHRKTSQEVYFLF